MPELLRRQSGLWRGQEIRRVRRKMLWRALVSLGLAAVVIVIVGGVLLPWAAEPTMNHVTLTITNGTPAPMTDVGFSDCTNERVVSLGPVAAGQTKTLSADYDENDCPTGFSFDQPSGTRHAELGGDMLQDGDVFDMTLALGQLTVKRVRVSGATTRFVQVPTTQPVQYLDQNGKPVPVGYGVHRFRRE